MSTRLPSASKSSISKKVGKQANKDSANSLGKVLPGDEQRQEAVDYQAWKVFSRETLQTMSSMTLVEQARTVADTLNLLKFQEDMKEASLVDCYLIAFAVEEGFSLIQTSSFLSVMHILVQNCKAGLSASQNLLALKEKMKGIGVTDKCPMGRFTSTQATSILQYLITSIFQHYRLFEYLFTEEQSEVQVSLEVDVPLLPDPATLNPPPLEEAVPEEFYRKYISLDRPDNNGEELQLGGNKDENVSDEVRAISENKDLPPNDFTPEEVQTTLTRIVDTSLEKLKEHVETKIQSSQETHFVRLSNIEKAIH